MPTLLSPVLKCFRKQPILLVRAVSEIPDIVYGIFRRTVSYMVNMLLIWSSDRHKEMIRYKAVNKYLPFIRHNLLPKSCVLYTPILTPNTAHVAESYDSPTVAVVRSFKFNPFFNHDINIII